MLTFDFEPYNVEVFNDTRYDIKSNDNVNAYEEFHLNTNDCQPTSIHGISLYKDKHLIKSIAVGASGGGTGVHKHSVIVNHNVLVICCSDTIFCFSFPALMLLWKTVADSATCFGVYEYQSDYIVHGELEITRLSNDGNIMWQHGGADIFTTLKGKDDFVITDNHILATDWEDRKYKFDFDGNIIV